MNATFFSTDFLWGLFIGAAAVLLFALMFWVLQRARTRAESAAHALQLDALNSRIGEGEQAKQQVLLLQQQSEQDKIALAESGAVQSQLHERLAQQQQLLADKEQECDSLRQNLAAAQVQCAEADTGIRLLGEQRSQAEQQAALLRQQREQLSVQLSDASAQLAAVQNERDGLREDKQALDSAFQHTRKELAHSREQVAALSAQLDAEQEKSRNQESVVEQAKSVISDQFKIMAQSIVDQQSQKFNEVQEKGLNDVIQPLHDKLSEFNQLIQNNTRSDTEARARLSAELVRLQQAYMGLHNEAQNLTSALVGTKNKSQGNWGEMVLSSVLEHSGLRQGFEFDVQKKVDVVIDGKQKTAFPDVVVNLPDGKHIVLDSKVSLTAYTRYVAATNPADEEQAMAQHIDSLRTHIKQLSAKSYHTAQGIISLDFVLMFVPNEAAYIAALERAPQLFSEGYEKQVLLTCPSTLYITLRTINNMWQGERQNQNALEIAEAGGKLFDKILTAANKLEDVGKALDKAQEHYKDCYSRLFDGKGNAANLAVKLKQLGAKTEKKLPDHLQDKATLWE